MSEKSEKITNESTISDLVTKVGTWMERAVEAERKLKNAEDLNKTRKKSLDNYQTRCENYEKSLKEKRAEIEKAQKEIKELKTKLSDMESKTSQVAGLLSKLEVVKKELSPPDKEEEGNDGHAHQQRQSRESLEEDNDEENPITVISAKEKSAKEKWDEHESLCYFGTNFGGPSMNPQACRSCRNFYEQVYA